MILRKQLSIFSVLVLFIGTACTDLFNTSNNGPKLEFSAHAPTEYPIIFNGDTLRLEEWGPDDAPPSFAGQVKEGHILIDGYFKMDNDCFVSDNSLSGKISRSEDAINITVKAKDRDYSGSCPTQPGPLLIYNAAVSKLNPGSYRVKVVHVNEVVSSHNWRDHKESIGPRKYLVFDEEFVIE